MKARTPLALALLVAGAPAPEPASGAELLGAQRPPRVTLPAPAGAAGGAPTAGSASRAAATAARAAPRSWIVAATPAGGAVARRVARAHGARSIAGAAFLVPRTRARAFAAALRARGLLAYAEPNRWRWRAQAPAPDPLSPGAAWRDRVVGAQVPPPVLPTSPLIAVVDTPIDPGHPEVAGSQITRSGSAAVVDFHGTATATVAAAPANGVGMLGIWPGARTLGIGLSDGMRISCADSARGIAAAIRAGAAVINMSYGAPSRCFTEEHQVQRAVKLGIVPVAASGNEAEQGNPLEYPASLAHVLTVGASNPSDGPTRFSNDNAAVDLAAPGIGILTGVPAAFDPDGGANGLGFAAVSGTSFSAPMVSAAVAWVRAARPDLTPGQAAQAVRVGARDVGQPGYERTTGFGVLDLGGALALPPPAVDPFEPNDDVRFVSGRAFRDPTPPVYRGSGPSTLAATIDATEDPIDVYRVRVRSGRRLRVAITPRVGDPDLFVYRASTRSVRRSRALAGSSRPGARTDRVSIRNRGRRTATYYVAVGFNRRKSPSLLNATYALRAS